MAKTLYTDRDAVTAQLGKNLLRSFSRNFSSKKEINTTLYDWIIQSFQQTNCVLELHETVNQYYANDHKDALLLEAYDKAHTNVPLLKLYAKDLDYSKDKRDFGLMNDWSIVISKLNTASKIFGLADSKDAHEAGITIDLVEKISLRDHSSGKFVVTTPVRKDQTGAKPLIKLDSKGLTELNDIIVHEKALNRFADVQEFWQAHGITAKYGPVNFTVAEFGDCKPPKDFNYIGRVLSLTKENIDIVHYALNAAINTRPTPKTTNTPPPQGNN